MSSCKEYNGIFIYYLHVGRQSTRQLFVQLPTESDSVNTAQLLLGNFVQAAPIIARGQVSTSVVRLRSFGSLVLWILLRSPPDLLHR